MNNTNPLELLSKDPVEFRLISLKSKMMIIITKIINDNGWTQKEAANVLGVTQPRISNVVNGNITKFSIDMLFEMLGKLGYLMDISFDPESEKNPISMTVNKSII